MSKKQKKDKAARSTRQLMGIEEIKDYCIATRMGNLVFFIITEDGILEPGAPDFERKLLMLQRKPRARYRINHISWWAQEMPSEAEYAEARRNLAKVDWAVDYVITHCAPTSIALMENRHNEADSLTDFLQEVKERAHYHYWLFGHYHDNRAIDEKHILLWEQIIQVI